MKILIVEDSKTDRELLKYLLESRFQREAKFREAGNLESATTYLMRGDIDCVILDLQLPDSAGKETFLKLSKQFPQVPIIVMTNNKDRNLALEMIQNGAADYVIKNFTDEEDIFRRVLFAIEKHSRTVTVPPDEAASVRKLEIAKARMLTAHQSGEHKAIQTTTVETTNAIADLSRRMFTEIQKINTTVTQQGTRQEHMLATVDKLNTELLDGYPNRPSLKSQLEILNKRVEDIEEHFDLERNTHFELQKAEKTEHMSRRTQIIVALIGLLGLLLGAAATAYFAHKTPPQEQGQKP